MTWGDLLRAGLIGFALALAWRGYDRWWWRAYARGRDDEAIARRSEYRGPG